MKLDDYTWRDARNAVGFAAECARAVLPIFERAHQDDRPRKAIEIAEAYARGETIDRVSAIAAAADHVDVADYTDVGCAATHVADAARYAADTSVAAVAIEAVISYATDAAVRADPTLDVDVIHAHWILRDLYGGNVPIDRLEPALGALSVSIEMAKEVLGA